MRVLAACSLGGIGDFQPLVPFLDAARRIGHDTLVIGPSGLRSIVEDAGHHFQPGGEPPETEVGPIREQLPILPAAEASRLGNEELFGRLATAAMLPSMEELLREWRPDLVLRDPCEYASAVAARPLNVSAVQVAIGLAEVEWGSIEVAAPALEAYRPGLVQELRGSPYVTRFPASMDPSPFPDTRRFCERPALRARVGDWWAGSNSPLIYVTFGTVMGYMTIAGKVFRAALEAVDGLDARVLLTVGRHFDTAQLAPVPGNVHIEAWVDQADVFPEAAVVVCHGGSGTTYGALAAGVPVVIVPAFADQFANGHRVVEAGAGIAVEPGQDDQGRRRPINETDAARIREAIIESLRSVSYRAAARTVAAEMATAPSPLATLQELLPVE